MCGIAGAIGKDAGAKAIKIIASLSSRGKEAAGIAWTPSEAKGAPAVNVVYSKNVEGLPKPVSRLALAHTLHAMVGCVSQPIARDGSRSSKERGVLVANCEIYNWRSLAQHLGVDARNDADLLCALLDEQESIDEHAVASVCERLDGVYAFAYYRDERIVFARDLLGVKPLFIANEAGTLAFASEPQALRKASLHNVQELFPRTILCVDVKTGAQSELTRPFFEKHSAASKIETSKVPQVSSKLGGIISEAVSKRIPDEPFALFLGGGVDSAMLAQMLAQHKPRCYTVGTEASRDVAAAKEICARLGLNLTVVDVDSEALAKIIPQVVETIDDGNAVKSAVGAITWLASEAAAKDGMRCAFSGFGADEVFAATARAQASTDEKKEIISALLKLHERDLFRDDSITMRHGIELRLPYLDRTVIEWSLSHTKNSGQPSEEREENDKWLGEETVSSQDKKVLREAAVEIGVPRAVADTPRRAPQYGSGVMRLLSNNQDVIANSSGERKGLGASIASTRGPHRKLAALLSGGKDSVLAIHIMHDMGYEITCAVTIESSNPDSYLYHTPNVELAKLQSQAMSLPFLTANTSGEPELEIEALARALAEAKEKYAVQGVVTGAIRSNYQRERIEKIADRLGLTVYSPLWQADQAEELRRLVREGYSVVFTKVAAEGLDESWLGEEMNARRIEKLLLLQKKSGIQPAGEGGEYETLVLDAPLFKERIAFGRTEAIKDGIAATLLIKDARLIPKR